MSYYETWLHQLVDHKSIIIATIIIYSLPGFHIFSSKCLLYLIMFKLATANEEQDEDDRSFSILMLKISLIFSIKLLNINMNFCYLPSLQMQCNSHLTKDFAS